MPPLRYFVPNALTAASLVLGLGSIALSSKGDFELAAWMILWATLLDKADGTAARLCKATSSFGVEFDSFADFVAFGIAPAALFFYRLSAVEHGVSAISATGAAIYVVALAVRLARFNLTTSTDAPLAVGGAPAPHQQFFQGVPGTLLGAVLASGYLTWQLYQLPDAWLAWAPYLLIGSAALMVSTLRLPKLTVRKNKLLNVVQFGNVAVVYVIGPLRLFPQYLLGLALLYLIGGLVAGAIGPLLSKQQEASEEVLEVAS